MLTWEIITKQSVFGWEEKGKERERKSETDFPLSLSSLRQNCSQMETPGDPENSIESGPSLSASVVHVTPYPQSYAPKRTCALEGKTVEEHSW